jgi:transcription elongation factor SPT6
VLLLLPLLLLQTLISAVSQVGVDINAMVANPWRQGPLQFVPGLGPRKARALLAAIAASEDPFVKTRVDLLKQVRGVSSHASAQAV